MSLKMGVSVYSIPSRSIDLLINFVKKYDFSIIELWDSPLLDRHNTLTKLQRNDILEVSVHAPLLNIGNEDEYSRNNTALESCMRRCIKLDVNRIVLHAGKVNGAKDLAIEVAKKLIASKIDILEENGIVLCIENVGYLGNELLQSFKDLVAFADNFPKHLVGVVFDISHANIVGDPYSAIEQFGFRIKQIHLSDNIGEKNNHHLPIGMGRIDFNALDNKLIEDNTAAILEITPDKDWEKNLLDSRKYLKDLKIVG